MIRFSNIEKDLQGTFWRSRQAITPDIVMQSEIKRLFAQVDIPARTKSAYFYWIRYK